MSRTRLVCLLVVVACQVPVAGQDVPAPEVKVMTDLVPQSAIGAILFRNVTEMKKRGDAVTAKLGHPDGFSMLGKMVGGSLILGELIDDDRPCGAMWFERSLVEEPANRYRMHPIAVALAIKQDDLDDVAMRLDIEREAFERGETASGEGAIGYDKWFARLQGDYVWITSHEELFEYVLIREKTLTDVIPESRRQAIVESDGVFAANGTASEINHPWLVEESEKWLAEHKNLDPEEKHAVRDFFSMFQAVTWGTVSVRVDGGLAFNVDVFFDPKYHDAIETVLRRINPNGSASTLAGLPDAPVLLAHAAHVEGDATLPAIAVMVRELHKNWKPRWKNLDQRGFLSGIQELEMLGVFGEVWGRISSYRAALYRNPAPERFGLMSLVAVLDTHDAGELVTELRELGGFIDGTGLPLSEPGEPPPAATEEAIQELIQDLADRRYQVRQSATVRLTLIGEPALKRVRAAQESAFLEVRRRATRIRERIEAKVRQARDEAVKPGLIRKAKPTFVFHAAEEERVGKVVHVVEMKTAPGAEVEGHMQTAFGIGWRQIRFVPHGSRLVVMVGSDTALLDQTLRNLDNNAPGLAASKPEQLATNPLHAQRVAEFRIGVSRFLDLTRMAEPPAKDDPNADGKAPDEEPDELGELSGFGVTVRPDFILLEWRLSIEDLKQARPWWF